MIPRKIHYIWLGNKKMSNISYICINSWKEKMPDYEIIRWDESNLDLNKIAKDNKFFRKCQEKKLWAYMADYLRLYILYNNGGIYFDTDIQAINSLDDFLHHSYFSGMEAGNHYGTGVIAAEKYCPSIKRLLDFYDTEIWEKEFYTSPHIFDYVISNSQELFRECVFYPMEYFAPYDYLSEFSDSMITSNTYTIHWYDGTWKDNKQVCLFLQTKHINNPLLKQLVKFKKYCGYYHRKFKKKVNI
ncbi:glycosyl transferase [Bacillus sp. AFS006103]|nr:glycosyl transferase [Bacillus sp. AFS006103]